MSLLFQVVLSLDIADMATAVLILIEVLSDIKLTKWSAWHQICYVHSNVSLHQCFVNSGLMGKIANNIVQI